MIPIVRSLVGAFGRHFPVIFSFREPEKFSAMWLVATVVLIGHFLGSLDEHAPPGLSQRATTGAAAVIAVLLLLGAGRVPGLLAPTLRPVAYPADWYATSTYLERHPVRGRTAVLPWHHYFSLPFADDRLVQNPAEVFFPGDLLTAQEPEIAPGTTDSTSDILSAATAPGRQGCRLAQALRGHGVTQVVVLPFLEGPADLEDLRRCGFDLVQGRTTSAAVARDDHPGSGTS